MLEWTAPLAGTYVFSVESFEFDTVIGLFQPVCDGNELACNDDCFGTHSAVEHRATAGETLLIAVEGLDGQTGTFRLSIVETQYDLVCGEGWGDTATTSPATTGA